MLPNEAFLVPFLFVIVVYVDNVELINGLDKASELYIIQKDVKLVSVIFYTKSITKFYFKLYK